ncbi:Ubiquinone biosynthesis protein coq9, mitochondrial [Pichia californica]|uniref:Ubiquinone biosynthesis protein n=1 Tax=Pichia californica TaxID=460514 RepID=A0A9P7BFY7_9ASCO|nr:Ubiquinone biosynthesis protein coq9, mitochondrial [[Candida] californica]KAG0687738.1 Ubiquinone biosynthesis protein coq9, mitochondrial [[Candida] californica]
MTLRLSIIRQSNKCISNVGLKRNYHSFYHINKPIIDMKLIENQILNKAYEEYVPEFGFTNKSIENASFAMGLNNNSPNAIFNFTSLTKNLEMELILFHLKKCRENLNLLIKNKEFLIEFNKKSEFEKLNYLLNKRLLMNKPILKFLPNILGKMILPNNLNSSLIELHNLSDDITYYSGDRSNDFAWYSKRFSISSLYIQSELFQINDKSNDLSDTFKFVNDRLKEIENAAYIYNSVEEWAFFNAVSTINIIKSQLAKG